MLAANDSPTPVGPVAPPAPAPRISPYRRDPLPERERRRQRPPAPPPPRHDGVDEYAGGLYP